MIDDFADDLVVTADPALPERYFDRFMFNAHPADATAPSIIVGLGTYPHGNVMDGFAVVTTGAEQRNHRFSTELDSVTGQGAGGLGWEVIEPLRAWRITLGPNPTGLAFDLRWDARAPAWSGEVAVTNEGEETTSFQHLFQSGIWTGELTLDGRTEKVDGWYGQRDRSRGVRTMAGGQGLHLWYQAQFPDRCVGFLNVESRTGERVLLEGAVMHTDGTLDPVTDVRHDLTFNDHLDLRSGRVAVETAGGRRYVIDADASAGGGYMAGAGYGGHHGRPQGRDHVEGEVWPLGSVSPLDLDSALTDRLTAFSWEGTAGTGILEFALTRSRSYRYRPTLI